LLASLRSHFFLQPLMAVIPVVVQAKGGGALDVCFNTVAVLCALFKAFDSILPGVHFLRF
jgi:hypothetical protein